MPVHFPVVRVKNENRLNHIITGIAADSCVSHEGDMNVNGRLLSGEKRISCRSKGQKIQILELNISWRRKPG